MPKDQRICPGCREAVEDGVPIRIFDSASSVVLVELFHDEECAWTWIERHRKKLGLDDEQT